MTAPKPGQTTCATCGHGMVRRVIAHLCGGGGPGPVYSDPVCSNAGCPDVQQDLKDAEDRYAQRRLEQSRRDELAIADAVARGVIDP